MQSTKRFQSLMIRKLFLYSLPFLCLLLQEIQVISSHSVHYKHCHTDIPACKQKEVPPDLESNFSLLHLRFIVLCYSLSCVYLLHMRYGTCCKVSFLDNLTFKVTVANLFFGRKDKGGIKATKNSFKGILKAIHN